MTVIPTIRQRELGKRLRELRNQHGLSVEDVAKELVCSASKVSDFEIGSRLPSLHEVRDLCRIYHADKSMTAEIVDLAKEAKQKTWWTQYEDLKLDPFLGLEQVATSITSFTAYYVPALLQTEEYARKVINSIAPRMDPDVYRQRVEARMRRQQVLHRSYRPRYRVLLDEAVLHRQVGDPALMLAQLDKVLNAAHDARVTVEVIPFTAGIPAAQDSNFVLLEFDEMPDMSPIVFVEGLIGNQYLEDSADIARYREAIDYLSDTALTKHDSIMRVTELRELYAGLLPQLAVLEFTDEGISMPSGASAEDLNWLVSRAYEGGACVAVARRGDSVLIKRINSEGPVAEFTMAEWLHFLAGAKQGDFDGITERHVP